jgi:predicted enzyme related to lactoylglutathione lyase
MATTTPTLRKDAILSDTTLFSSFAVKDLNEVRPFYRDTLGLEVRDDTAMGIMEIHGTGGSPVVVYPKPDHKPAGFTVLNFRVKDLDSTVEALTAAGVWMEQYDGQNGPKTNARGIVRDDGGAIAWFKDPAGNILAAMERDRA